MKNQHNTATLGRPRTNNSRSGQSNEDSPVQLRFDFERPAVRQATAAEPVNHNPAARFALRFAALLEAEPSTGFDNPAISQLAREIFGSSAGFARDAYDAAEAGFNIYLNRVGLDFGATPAAINLLLAEQARLPIQTRRDQGQIDFQQFSTPPAEALLVVKAASLRTGMAVLEPSAGTGNIAVLARLVGAQVDTNEIDERRRDLLSLQQFEPTALDAERLDNLLPADKNYHAIVMNPPFSATGGRVHGHRTAFGARHIEQALLRLKPGGRLVAIVGRGMAMDRPTFREWWSKIGERYRVRANVGMDGRTYAKFGTTFDNQIIVIDRDGPTTNGADILTASKLSIQAAYDLLKDLSEEDVYGRVCRQDQKTRSRGAPADLSAGDNSADRPDPGTSGASAGGRSRRRIVNTGRLRDNGSMANLEPASHGTARRTGPVNDGRIGKGVTLQPSEVDFGAGRGGNCPVVI